MRAAILGVGETEVGTLPGFDPIELQAMAIHAAMADAGLEPDRLDGLVNLESAAAPVFLSSAYLCERLGRRVRFLRTLDVGGTAGCIAMVQDAMWAVEQGAAEIVAVSFGTNARSRRMIGNRGLRLDKPQPGEEYSERVGITSMVAGYALVAARAFHERLCDREALWEIAHLHNRHALAAEHHQRQELITREQYFAAPLISWPLSKYDCSLVSDGAGALIIGRVTAETKHRPVYVAGTALSCQHASVAQLPSLDDLHATMRAVAETALAQSGLDINDMDALFVHDAFTVSVALALTALGAPRGAALAAHIASGAYTLGGTLPLNPHGGLLSQAHVGGILHVVEAVRQLRGEAGNRQIRVARTALVIGNGGVFATEGAMVLRGD